MRRAPAGRQARVLDRVLKVEEHAGTSAGVTLVHEYGPAPQHVGMALEREVNDRVEQGMPRTDKGRQRLPRWRDECLLKRDAFIPRQDRPADTDQAVAGAHRCRDVGDLVATGFPLPDRPAEPLKRVLKERFDVMRLETARLGTRHVFANPLDPAAVHRIGGEGVVLQQGLQVAAVEGVIEHGRQPRPHRRLVAIADRVDQPGRAGPAPRTAACRARRTPGPPSARRASSSLSNSVR